MESAPLSGTNSQLLGLTSIHTAKNELVTNVQNYPYG